jgi:hypothetical protein
MPYHRNQASGDIFRLLSHSETFRHPQHVVDGARGIAIKIPWGVESALVGVDEAGVAAADYDEVLPMLGKGGGRERGVCNQSSDVAGDLLDEASYLAGRGGRNS